MKLVRSISRFLTLLIDYRNELKRKSSTPKNVAMSSASSLKLPQNCMDPEIGCDDRLLICTYTLLRFCLDDIDSMNRKTIMSRYLEKLANIHTLLGMCFLHFYFHLFLIIQFFLDKAILPKPVSPSNYKLIN